MVSGGGADDRDLHAIYDAWSKTYDESYNPLIEIEEGVALSLLETIPFHDVLDAATGTGRYALHLAEQGKRVVAVDWNEPMLARAREKASARQLTIEFRQRDISDLSCEDASFDLVICALALAHVEHLAAPCREFVRVLRLGGHLIISDLHPAIQAVFGPDFESAHVEGEGPLFFPNYHARVEDYLQAVASAGAEVLEARDVGELLIGGGMLPGALVLWARVPGPGDQPRDSGR